MTFGHAGVIVLAQPPHVVTQQVHQWQIVPLFFRESGQRQLRAAGALGLVPVTRRPPDPGAAGRARTPCRRPSGRCGSSYGLQMIGFSTGWTGSCSWPAVAVPALPRHRLLPAPERAGGPASPRYREGR